MSKTEKTVVIVDDDADMGRAVARLVKAAGYSSISYRSGEALLGTSPVPIADIFVFDVHMPGMSGFDLAGRLLSIGVRTPVIFITALDDPMSRERAATLGAAGFVIKPFDSGSLLPLLSQAVHEQPSARDPWAVR